MVLAYCVYIFILVYSVGFAWLTLHCKQLRNYKIWRWDVLIPVLLVSLLMGFRYQVGTDWGAYLSYYIDIRDFGMTSQEVVDSTMEPLYLLLNISLASLHLPYQLFFTVIMFLHLILLYKSFDRYTFLLPWGLFFYVVTIFTTSLNIQRQTLSVCIFFFSLRYILDGKFIKYACCILVASLFHYSAIVLFPVYFLRLNGLRFFDNRLVQLLLYIVSFFLFSYALTWILAFVLQYVTNAKYLGNLQALGNWNMDVSSGLGILATHLIDILLIFFSKDLARNYKDCGFKVLFRIFLLGVCLSNVFGIDVFLSRIPFAMESLRFLMLAFLLHYSFVIKKKEWTYVLGGSILFLYLSMFLVSISNGSSGSSPFQFA